MFSLEKIKAFCEFNVANPAEFRVCQIPGAHFVMHRELQEYKYSSGEGSEAPDPRVYGRDVIYMPRWHVAGTIKISNPAEMKTKLIPMFKMDAILKYFGAYSWENTLIEGHQNSGGAVCAHKPGSKATLLLYNNEKADQNGATAETDYSSALKPIEYSILLRMYNVTWDHQTHDYLDIECLTYEKEEHKWALYNGPEMFYAAIVERHF